MKSREKRTRAVWIIGIVLILSLTLLGTQTIYPQGLNQEYPLGDIPLDPVTYQKHIKIWPEDMPSDMLLPAYDARDEGIVTSAKDQGSCGSCWAFASVGAMESHLLKKYAVGPNDLSEQQQVSCNTAMWGCDGGNSYAIRYWEDKGSLYEACFPYTASDGTPCAEAGCEQLGYRVIDFYTVYPSVTDFKTSLYNDGPSYWRFDVYDDFYTYWNHGDPSDVYVNQAGSSYRGGHAVLLIGWDDARGAYLCKNSWGEHGGPNGDGTFWIAYSGHTNGLGFGMSNFDLAAVGCSSNAECDDGLYCNGAETCVDNACQSGTPPECPDDGLFCNGSEICDEVGDACDHTGDPCAVGTICDDIDDRCVPLTCGNEVCDEGENCNTCPEDCIGGQGGGTCDACFKGVCNGECHPKKEGADCADCAPSWCCGDGVCEGEEDGFNCEIDCGSPPACGDGNCDAGEDPCSCVADCGAPPSNESSCSDGVDNDCDGYADCDDSDCSSEPICICLPKGEFCDADAECCSNKCRGGKCR